MIDLKIDKDQAKRLSALLGGVSKDMKKQVRIAINNTAKITQTAVSRRVRETVATSAKALKQVIRIDRKAIEQNLSAVIKVTKEKRLSLLHFGARQTKTGVTYKINKGEARKLAVSGFQGPRPGVMKRTWKGHAFKRVGKTKTPIVILRGPSLWGVVIKNKQDKTARKESQLELKKQIERRIRFLTLKQSGGLRGNQR